MIEKKYACIAFDLDGTLAKFNDDKIGLKNIFLDSGIKPQEFEKAYSKAKDNGFNFEKLIYFCATISNTKLNNDYLLEKLNSWLKQNLVLHEDARFLMNSSDWQTDAVLAIITFGNPQFQYQKIKHLGIKKDVCFFSDTKLKKNKAIELLAQNLKPILFVDNSLEELDALREAGYSSNVLETVWINRKNKASNKAKFQHLTIQNLSELKLNSI